MSKSAELPDCELPARYDARVVDGEVGLRKPEWPSGQIEDSGIARLDVGVEKSRPVGRCDQISSLLAGEVANEIEPIGEAEME